ncbi:hypothetical protein BDZ89DRAFT_1113628 [Hymenopellis radicata]|nr:hypothetical protein BDZ89DRAFT_1113628 [Hymenopellis radicata]
MRTVVSPEKQGGSRPLLLLSCLPGEAPSLKGAVFLQYGFPKIGMFQIMVSARTLEQQATSHVQFAEWSQACRGKQVESMTHYAQLAARPVKTDCSRLGNQSLRRKISICT